MVRRDDIALDGIAFVIQYSAQTVLAYLYKLEYPLTCLQVLVLFYILPPKSMNDGLSLTREGQVC